MHDEVRWFGVFCRSHPTICETISKMRVEYLQLSKNDQLGCCPLRATSAGLWLLSVPYIFPAFFAMLLRSSKDILWAERRDIDHSFKPISSCKIDKRGQKWTSFMKLEDLTGFVNMILPSLFVLSTMQFSPLIFTNSGDTSSIWSMKIKSGFPDPESECNSTRLGYNLAYRVCQAEAKGPPNFLMYPWMMQSDSV